MNERTDRLTSIVRELAATFIRDEANTNPLITVTNVTNSRDGKHVEIMVSVFPQDREADALIFLKRKGGDFRSFVKQHARLKRLPFFEFSIDRGEQHRQHMDDLINKADRTE